MTEHICVVWIRPTGGTTSEEFFSRGEATAWRNRLREAGYDAALVTLRSPPRRPRGRTKQLAVAAMLACMLTGSASADEWQQMETNRHLSNIERALKGGRLPLYDAASEARARYYDALTRELGDSRPKPRSLGEVFFGTEIPKPPPPCRTESRTTDGITSLCTTCCDAFRCATQCDPQ